MGIASRYSATVRRATSMSASSSNGAMRSPGQEVPASAFDLDQQQTLFTT
jgi:hypothetical protein